eukprot:11020214-Lingulodinium_polyedra.AAC.1
MMHVRWAALAVEPRTELTPAAARRRRARLAAVRRAQCDGQRLLLLLRQELPCGAKPLQREAPHRGAFGQL